MKLSFKEWTLVYECLTEKARSLASDLKWREDWAKEHDAEEDSDTREIRGKLNAVNKLIQQLETATV